MPTLLTRDYSIEMADVKRPYRSPKRRSQAEDTRRQILSQARLLFVESGYGRATIAVIAAAAGVAPQTVYAIFGSKRGILMALLDQLAVEADPATLARSLEDAAGDEPRQLRALLAFNIRFYSAGIDLIDVARTVQGVEDDLRAMWQEGEARRRRSVAGVVTDWERAGALAPGLTAAIAADLLWALSGPDVFRLLVIERDWDQRQFEEMMAGMLEQTLFPPASRHGHG